MQESFQTLVDYAIRKVNHSENSCSMLQSYQGIHLLSYHGQQRIANSPILQTSCNTAPEAQQTHLKYKHSKIHGPTYPSLHIEYNRKKVAELHLHMFRGFQSEKTRFKHPFSTGALLAAWHRVRDASRWKLSSYGGLLRQSTKEKTLLICKSLFIGNFD